ncbi:MAG TPA: acyl-CoA dehydrogenase family protein, partial [Rhodospirillales bacterium]
MTPEDALDFQLTDDQRQLKDAARAFAVTEMAPLARALENENRPLPRDQVKRLAEMAMRLEASRLLIWRAAQNAEGKSQGGLPSILDSSLAKCFANEMVREVAGAALQVMGAYGYSKEFAVEQKLRDGWGWG